MTMFLFQERGPMKIIRKYDKQVQIKNNNCMCSCKPETTRSVLESDLKVGKWSCSSAAERYYREWAEVGIKKKNTKTKDLVRGHN